MSFSLFALAILLVFGIKQMKPSTKGIYTSFRENIVKTLLLTGGLCWLYCEIFSALDALSAFTASAYWGFVVVLLGVYLRVGQGRGDLHFRNLGPLRALARLEGISAQHRLLIGLAVCAFIIPLFFLAVYVPPNNYDSHHYHLNRLVLWEQYGNLGYFPTQHIQQLYLNVFAEYIVLNIYLLTGSDQLTGLVQFGAFLGSLTGVSLLAKNFGMKQGGQLLALLFMLTLPIGIFESTSTQVDYVACFFFITYVYFGFSLLKERSAANLFFFLLSLAFAAFTKYSTLPLAFPLTVYFAFRLLGRYGFFYSARVLVFSLALFAVVFTPFCLRNYELFGSLLSPPTTSPLFTEKIPVDKYSLTLTLSGLVKNSGLHLGLPDNGYNLAATQAIAAFHQWLGVDLNDLAVRLDQFSVRFSVHEDMVPNTFHFLLMGLATVILLVRPASAQIRIFWLMSLLGFVMFSTLLKFQAWSTRTHMPLFAMGAVAVAYAYTSFPKWRISFPAIALLMGSAVFVYGNPNKPLVAFPYLFKKALAHIPVAICPDTDEKLRFFREHLSAYYDFNSGQGNCYPIRQQPPYAARKEIFRKLEEAGYYDEIRKTVFSMPRSEMFFLSHTDNYRSMQPLVARLGRRPARIGVLFSGLHGYYHFWKLIAEETGMPPSMNYIYYRHEFDILKNTRKPFCYDYILTDNPELLEKLVPRASIKSITGSTRHSLVELKQESCARYTY